MRQGSAVYDIMGTQLGLQPLDVFLIINHTFPNDNTANQLQNRLVPARAVYTPPFSVAVMYITDYRKELTVTYDVPGDSLPLAYDTNLGERSTYLSGARGRGSP
ncbi:hypothetical protein [Caldivirga sp.]|uniref:hypothetical protein n=1 Tax=Caldivirga sp. TaxID=2080243 RepID=UPI003D0D35ED